MPILHYVPLELPNEAARQGAVWQLGPRPVLWSRNNCLCCNASRPDVVSVDINPVAVAITRAKSSHAFPHEIVDLAKVLLNEQEAVDIPYGQYWHLAYEPAVLSQICSIREGLYGQQDEVSNALRGVMLGCLHGPIYSSPSHLSNQMQRSFHQNLAMQLIIG